MGMNNTPASDRIHIGFFGRRNAGKSSVLNAVTGQDLAVVSDVKGTTTDPVYKAMELLPLGPVMMIDTPGIDDEGRLGSLRVRKSYQVLNKTDVAVLVMDACHGPAPEDYTLLKKIGEKQIPCVAVCNKADLDGAAGGRPEGIPESVPVLSVSAHTGQGITALKECLAQLGKTQETSRKIVGDLLSPSDMAVLVVPIDKAAPKGRLILPQQQTIRDILEADAVSVVVRENGLRDTLASLGKKPRMVITDSQVFAKVSADTPEDILLTSFSILFAGYKGDIQTFLHGAKAIASLTENSTVLIAEACAHAPTTEDIGREKIPRLLRQRVGQGLSFTFLRGNDFPQDLSPYDLIIHCGACMFNRRHVIHRIAQANTQGIPISNYGVVLAYLTGILDQVSHT